MRLDQFDLNLLIAFDALMTERNVTIAARRLNLTQSAMSSALKRLRESLGDDLLVQHGKRMIPTERALQLAPEVADVIHSLRHMISGSANFDPSRSTRCFRIVASDYVATVLIGPLKQRLQRIAPGVGLNIGWTGTASHQALEDGEVDLILQPEVFVETKHPTEFLHEDRFVVLGCQDNPLLGGALSAEQYYAAPHVAVEIDGYRSFIDAAIDRNEPRRKIELVAPSFVTVPWILPGTGLLALVHERLAKLVRGHLPLAMAECPVALPVMREVIQYHSARRSDQGLRWLREELQRQGRENED